MPIIRLTLLLVLFSYSWCLANTTVIKGQVLDLPSDAVSNFAIVGIHQLIEKQKQVKHELGFDGKFELSFELSHTQDVYFRAGDTQFNLLLEPGDTLELTWLYQEEERKTLPLGLKFSGNNAERNRHFVAMMQQYKMKIDLNEMGEQYKEMSALEFLEYRMDRKVKEEQVLTHYLSENKIEDKLLHQWVGHFLTYVPASNLIGYPIIHAQNNQKRPQELEIPDSFYDFMQRLEINDTSAFICSRYIRFLDRDYYQYKFMQPQFWPDYKERKERDGMIPTFYNHMAATSDGVAREIILTKLLLMMMEQRGKIAQEVPPLLENYYDLVQEHPFVEMVLSKYKLRYDEKDEIKLASHINILDLEGDDEAVLTNLVKRFAGKAIYIDIWSTWCGPCISEMKHYPKLIEKYQDKDLEFVFLAALSPERLWQHRINEYALNAYQYLLNEKEYYALEKYFELRGFPQHIIIDKTGKVVESKGPPISFGDGEINQSLLAFLDGVLEK